MSSHYFRQRTLHSHSSRLVYFRYTSSDGLTAECALGSIGGSSRGAPVAFVSSKSKVVRMYARMRFCSSLANFGTFDECRYQLNDEKERTRIPRQGCLPTPQPTQPNGAFSSSARSGRYRLGSHFSLQGHTKTFSTRGRQACGKRTVRGKSLGPCERPRGDTSGKRQSISHSLRLE